MNRITGMKSLYVDVECLFSEELGTLKKYDDKIFTRNHAIKYKHILIKIQLDFKILMRSALL